MKTKKVKVKLSLNKKTIANLNAKAMNGVNGGATYGCPTFITDCRTDCVTNCPICPSEYCTTENTLDQYTCYESCPVSCDNTCDFTCVC